MRKAVQMRPLRMKPSWERTNADVSGRQSTSPLGSGQGTARLRMADGEMREIGAPVRRKWARAGGVGAPARSHRSVSADGLVLESHTVMVEVHEMTLAGSALGVGAAGLDYMSTGLLG